MFPEEYSKFTTKYDASYDGDPNGDYVVAQHVNDLQDAIVHIEEAIGIVPQANRSLSERIQTLESIRPMRVPSVGYFSGSLGSEESYIVSILSKYQTVVLTEATGVTSGVVAKVQAERIPVYGQINALASLSVIQSNIGSWKQKGVEGVYLTSFGDGATPLRSEEQAILSSVKQAGLSVMIQGMNWKRLFSKGTIASYNPSGESLNFPADTTIVLNDFAYNFRAYVGTELLETVFPSVKLIRESGMKVMGFSNAQTQDNYNYVQAAGLLFGLDYLYNGASEGTTLEGRSPDYNWPSYLADWQTEEPILFQEGTSLYRNIPNGRITLYEDTSIAIEGYAIDSQLINWYQGSVPGSAIADGSLSPTKLSGYDIAAIIALINDPLSNLRIKSEKIETPDGGTGIPVNIPALNMMEHVIEAINRHNVVDGTVVDKIIDESIQSLSASKLTGSLHLDRMKNAVIPAINASATLLNKIDVPAIKVTDLEVSRNATILNALTADTLNGRVANISGMLTTPGITMPVGGYLTGYNGEFFNLYVEQLKAKTITGIENLDVINLSADNMDTLVLNAVEANIANGYFGNLMADSIFAGTIQADLISALNLVVGTSITNSALFGDAVIDSASIKELAVGKLMSGTIDTSVINLSSPDGHLSINDKTIKIYDDADVQDVRRQRVQLGDISEWSSPETPADYGLIVFGPDGETRLYDHTGVYNAGIKPNAISEAKIQDDAISSRTIKAGAVIADHILAGTINATLIGADQILAKHILAGEITAEHLHAGTITANEIASGTITSGLIAAGAIEASHLSAHSITADKLAIGFQANLIQDGFDSFEQIPNGPIGVLVAGTNYGEVQTIWASDGTKSLYLEGPTASNRIRLSTRVDHYAVPVTPGETYAFSTYARTYSSNAVALSLGVAFENKTFSYSNGLSITAADRQVRRSYVFTVPEGVNRLAVVLGVQATNVGVYFDCLQVELLTAGQTQPGVWRSTATTVIDGGSIKTGYIAAKHIHIGGGSVFGQGDIIDITDAGIKARSVNGYAMLNASGLEIHGGAFHLTSDRQDGNSVLINGEQGIAVENPYSLIEIDAVDGFKIVSKTRQQVIMDVDPTQEVIRMSGKTLFLPADSQQMAWSMDDKMSAIDTSLSGIDSAVTTLTDTTLPALEDGLLTKAEKTGIQTSADIVAVEKKDIDAVYNALYSNENLVVKTVISTPKGAYDTAYTTLTTAITTVMNAPDGVALPANSVTAARNALSAYADKLALLRTAMQTAQNTIEAQIQTETQNSLNAALQGYVDNVTYGTDKQALQNQVDKSITTWFGEVEPTMANHPASTWPLATDKDVHLGDIYYNTITGYAYRFLYSASIYSWTKITDSDIMLALANAETAQDTADGKRRVFVAQPVTPYDIGDLWTQGTTGDLMRCKTAKSESGAYAAGDWEKASKYTDDTIALAANIAANSANKNLNSLRQSMDNTKAIRLGMKIGYSSFSTLASGYLYLCGLQLNPTTFVEELADVNGSLYGSFYNSVTGVVEPRVTIAVAKQAVNLNGVALGTTGYLIWDNTAKAIWFAHFIKTVGADGVVTAEYWNKRNVGKVGDNTELVLDASTYVIGELEI